MVKYKSCIFYFLVIFSILVSLYDIYFTVLTVDTIHVDEMNPIAKQIIILGNNSRACNGVTSCQGVAFLVWIKSMILCVISSTTTMFHYSQNQTINNVLFGFCIVYFLQNILLLWMLLS